MKKTIFLLSVYVLKSATCSASSSASRVPNERDVEQQRRAYYQRLVEKQAAPLPNFGLEHRADDAEDDHQRSSPSKSRLHDSVGPEKRVPLDRPYLLERAH